jgi:hypothetical protein
VTPSPRTAAAFLAAAVLVSHFPLLSAGYVQDDHVAVEHNATVAAGSVATILRSGYWDATRGGDRSLWRPVTVASFAMESALLSGPRPGVSHAVNLALHAAVCWLLFSLAVACGIEPSVALLAALVFAVTPSKSEAVANVVGRAEILAAGLTLAAARLSLIHGSRAAAWGAAACVLAAAGSKETGFVAAALVVLAAGAAPRVIDRLGMIAPSVLALVVAIVLRTRALEALFPAQSVPVIDNPLVREHGARYGATALALVTRYARIAVFPFRLSNDYSGASIPIQGSFAGAGPLLGALIVAALGALALRGRTAALFVAIIVLPYVLIGNIFVPAGAILAERFLYLPVAGLCLLAAWAAGSLSRRLAGGALAAVVILCGAMVVRSRDWRDDATIFAATAKHNPKSPKAPLWLGRYDDAIANWPEFAAAWHEKGVALAKAGDLSGAERALSESVRLEPQRAAPHLALGLVLHREGRLDAAEREVAKSILIDPDVAQSHAELGHLRYEAGRLTGAAEAYRRAVALGRVDLLPRLREIDATLAPGSAPPR